MSESEEVSQLETGSDSEEYQLYDSESKEKLT